jgi:hypothetical protein
VRVKERENLIMIKSIPYHIISECKKWAILAFHVSQLGIDKGCFDEQNIFKWAFNCNFNISISTWMDGWMVGVWTRNIFLKICVLGLTMVVSYVLTTNHRV